MDFAIKHQESYSRGQLLLRTFLGWLYIAIPHFFLLLFVAIWSGILSFLAFWAILFTGKYPAGWYAFQVKFMSWGARLSASLYNLTDTYPAFLPGGTSEAAYLKAGVPEKISRGKTILRTLFGFIYVLIPHVFCLYFRLIASGFVMLIAWFAVLFSGKYPESMHAFNVGTLRWSYRLNMYIMNMTDDYPPFSGK
jgi:hypothetical protein